MELKSFVVTIKEFLTFEKERQEGNEKELLFFNNINQYSIPLYQREYKWEEVRVKELIHDIKNQNKFLGIIILNRKKASYDIVDGQQRVTTIILLLAVLFNRMSTNEQSTINLEQKHILQYIKNGSKLILKNESIGEWLILEANKIILKINQEKDIFHQEKIFNERWKDIEKDLENAKAGRNFFENLLGSKVLVLICDNLEHTYSSEQIFLDMNDKVDPLDAEDIFKSYCFNIVHSENHDLLERNWIKVKSNYFNLKDWGWSDFSTFLYHYLLCLDGNENIHSNLKINGRHFLENKTEDYIMHMFEELIVYTDNLNCFKNNLSNDSYRFNDICQDCKSYNVDINELKDMCKYILDKKDQYYKFPFLMLINVLYNDPELNVKLKFKTFKRIVSNYYVYAFAFVNRRGEKDKGQINRTILKLLKNGEKNLEDIVEEIKGLRKNSIKIYNIPDKFKNEKGQIYALYTIIDLFNLQDNVIPQIYSYKNSYNDEHFIIHDNKKYNIFWINNEDKKSGININLDDYYDKNDLNRWKELLTNHLIIPEQLNEDLESFDIVTKISKIEKYYREKFKGIIPKHIVFFIAHITEMETYKKLEELKDIDVRDEKNKLQIIKAYKKFVETYFDNLITEGLRNQLQQMLQAVFMSSD